uniref:Ovule protein n=1 Tax=Angiostrongylus cantonensis TaxID=6313 RepID=A0A0K0D9I4_ANGCA
MPNNPVVPVVFTVRMYAKSYEKVALPTAFDFRSLKQQATSRVKYSHILFNVISLIVSTYFYHLIVLIYPTGCRSFELRRCLTSG